MNKAKLSSPGGEEFPSSTLSVSSMSQEKESVDSSSTEILAPVPLRQPICNFSGITNWSGDADVQELILAFSVITSEGNWLWLGNSSECRAHEGFQSLAAYLGYQYSEDEPDDRHSASTAITLQPRRDVGATIENLFRVGRNEIFEDGMESSFSRELVALVRMHGEVAILEIARIITSEYADACVDAETLKWMGRIKDARTHSFRRWLLLRGLTSSNTLVREGAGLGLSFMNDPDAISWLKQAVEREQVSELREDLSQILQQLQHVD